MRCQQNTMCEDSDQIRKRHHNLNWCSRVLHRVRHKVIGTIAFLTAIRFDHRHSPWLPGLAEWAVPFWQHEKHAFNNPVHLSTPHFTLHVYFTHSQTILPSPPFLVDIRDQRAPCSNQDGPSRACQLLTVLWQRSLSHSARNYFTWGARCQQIWYGFALVVVAIRKQTRDVCKRTPCACTMLVDNLCCPHLACCL